MLLPARSISEAMDSMKVFSDPNRPHSSNIRILDVKHQFEDYNYRSPFQFGGRTVDRVTLLNVTVRVVSASGKEASGFGSMPLGNLWSFPSLAVSYDESLEAMTR